MQHVKLAVLVAAATVVLIEALEGVFDAGEVGYAPIDGLQEVVHRQEGSIESRDMIVVERQVGSTAGYLLNIFHQFLDTCHLGERRSHSPNAPGAYLLGMGCQLTALAYTATAYMHDDLEVG